jgi:TRAP-type transport system small permease protein
MKAAIRVVELIVTTLIAVITAVVFGEVVMRGLFSRSLIVTDELSRYLMIWVVLLGGVLLVRDGGHIRVDFVVDALPRRLRRVLLILADILSLVFLLALTASSLLTTLEMRGQQTITLGVPVAIFYAAFPVGGALMMLLVAGDLVRRVAGRQPERQ